jgi:ParB-like chromosome segregation protein Spo0J
MSNTNKNELVQKVIDYIGFSDAAMSKAAGVLKTHEETQEKVARLIPEAVKACVENERIEAHQKEALAEALKDPARAVELVIKLAAHKNAAEMSRLGTPVATKTAGYDPTGSLSSGYVGARDGRLKASDVRLFTGLGLNPPTT